MNLGEFLEKQLLPSVKCSTSQNLIKFEQLDASAFQVLHLKESGAKNIFVFRFRQKHALSKYQGQDWVSSWKQHYPENQTTPVVVKDYDQHGYTYMKFFVM